MNKSVGNTTTLYKSLKIQDSEVDRRTVLNVGVDLYNNMIRGALDLFLIANILGREDKDLTQGEMAELLERIGNVIETCDTDIVMYIFTI